jgi:HTH-type transcriptional regulator, competence development regulator
VRFGERLRELRKARNLSQRTLGSQVGVSFTYISKVENEKLDFGDYPSGELICKLARALEVDEDDLLFLAKKIPAAIRERLFERPDVFRALARCDDKTLDKLLAQIAGSVKSAKKKNRIPRQEKER